MRSFALRSIIILLIVLLIGCANTPLKFYPDFPEQKLRITTGALLADVVVIDDMVGDTNKIDVVANKSLGGMVLTYFTEKLVEKGYHVDNTMLTSVGLLMDQHRLYKLVQSVRSKEVNVGELPIGIPPFYLNDIFQKDTNAVAQLWSTYNTLINVTPQEEGAKMIIPAAVGVGKQAEASTLMVVFIGGYNVASSKQYTDELASDAQTVGMVGVKHISQVTIAFYIVDALTGEVLWSDQYLSRGGTIHKEKILHLADKIIDGLP